MGKITANGYERDSYSDISTDIKQIYTDNYGANFVTDPATPQGQQITAIVDIVDKIEDDKIELNTKYDLDSATDTDLDSLGAIIGIPRLAGTPSQANVTITSSTVGYTIPAGTEFNILEESDTVFINDAAINVLSTLTQVTLKSKENKNYNIQAGDYFETALAFPEIQNIIVDSYIEGSEVESDFDYLARIKLLRTGPFRQSGNQRVYKSIFEVDDVLDVRVYNGAACHINAVVLGGDNTEIANSILNSLDGGTMTEGAITVTVQDFQNEDVDIKFDAATQLQIGLNLQYSLKTSVALTTEEVQDIKNRYIDFCNGFKIKEKMATSDFINIIVQEYGSKIYINSIDFIESAVNKQIIEPNDKSYIRADVNDLTVTEV